MKVALYARVSTKQHGQDTETQLLPMRDYAKARKFDIAGEYVDTGWTGAKERRPQLDRLMRDAKGKKFDAVLVWKFDRFARSTTHLLAALDEFDKQKTDFISLTESIDTSTAMGRMVFTILGAVAQMERELIRERVQAGVDRARRQGKRLGRPSVLVDRVKIQERVQAGESISQIARDCGIARRTVNRIAQNRQFQAGGQNPQLASGQNPAAATNLSA